MDISSIETYCYNQLPVQWRREPWRYVNHGVDLLETGDQLNAYMAAYCEIHATKCRMAMQNFPFESMASMRNGFGTTVFQEFEIFDWGCGQGIATAILLEMLKERDMFPGLRCITLIEPSAIALDRAVRWIKPMVGNQVKIRTINRFIPANGSEQWTDVQCSAPVSIHLMSNILDIPAVGLRWLAEQTTINHRHNIYVCVGPKYGGAISRISDFYGLLGKPECFADFSRYPCGYTSRTCHAYGIEVKGFTLKSVDFGNPAYIEQSKQKFIDEYLVNNESLQGVLPDEDISAYNSLKEAVGQSLYKLYLRPAVCVDRPDFILTNITKGIVIVNICKDISHFGEDFRKVQAIKAALFDTYIKSLKIDSILAPSSYNTVKIGLYFPYATEEEINDACAKFYAEIVNRRNSNDNADNTNAAGTFKMPKDPTQYMVKLTAKTCREALSRVNCRGVKSAVIEEIEEYIKGRWHLQSQGDKDLILTPRQAELVNDTSLRLRVRGVAGSGKTLVVAHKAVKEHLRSGTKVLIITFNISLVSYLKMCINRVCADFSTDAFDITNYHQFFLTKARRYGTGFVDASEYNNAEYFEKYKEEIRAAGDRYDTIIVDEVQDFMTEWIDCIRSFLTENGKLILFGDGGQNIYKRKVEAKIGMPVIHDFENTPWRWINGDKKSIRQKNKQIAVLASEFAKAFGISANALDSQSTIDDLESGQLKYLNLSSVQSVDEIARVIVQFMSANNLSERDTVIIGESVRLLREVDASYRRQAGRESVMRTFESKETFKELADRYMVRDDLRSQEDRQAYDAIRRVPQSEDCDNVNQFPRLTEFGMAIKTIRRVAKVHFTTDTELIKFSTIHSFKGWESKTVILIIQPEPAPALKREEDSIFILHSLENTNASIYTGITRARENLMVINLGNKKYDEFFLNHKQLWQS